MQLIQQDMTAEQLRAMAIDMSGNPATIRASVVDFRKWLGI